VHAKYKGKLKNASLGFTTSSGIWKDRKWGKLACSVGKEEVIARTPLPAGTTAYILNAYDNRDDLVNSDLVVIAQ